MRLLRRARLPRDVRSRLRLAPGERILAHAEAEGGTLVATTRALHLPEGRAVPWEHIDRARWSDEGFTFTEEGSGDLTLWVPRPGRLAEAAHERITATIVVSRYVSLTDGTDGRGFRLVARRPPGGSDITWRVHLDEGVDPRDPHVEERVSWALSQLREQLGI
ncbi:hypothetical protein FHX37_0993 [Haloactinospora alba]|uniref:Uncharacterized protein n=1 Tax=Haloactinospora alba TaxID=405555 RepID=A0A543NH45_9ACTN|nr:hypothetical protein [Haloactinospora alba]TQN31104.1 hypothetical protein FHX37_0993 [Haloactinospora alba]